MTDIPNFEGLYAATRDGRIWSHPKSWKSDVNGGHIVNHKGAFLKGKIDRYGYHVVNLTKKGRRNMATTHRLVSLTYIPNPKNLPQVNHKNGIKTDNRVENLEWCTSKENILHSFKLGLSCGRKGENHPLSRLTQADVNEIRKLFREGMMQKDIAPRYGIRKGYVSKICRHIIWT